MPQLLEQLGTACGKIVLRTDWRLQHNPEPWKRTWDIMGLMKKGTCDVAFVVDPDVDRLAIICENGAMYWKNIHWLQ